MKGSSPRLRGTLFRRRGRQRRRGIIPALAGNTIRSWYVLSNCWDHPRACGEHDRSVRSLRHPLGSSPRLRGTRALSGWSGRQFGIIPALAGNTCARSPAMTYERDHPRACGEHVIGVNPEIAALGSSPRLRGTRCVIWRAFPYDGIIPALAGNTWSSTARPRPAWDHPRACGEHPRKLSLMTDAQGSSPRLRGTRFRPRLHR